MTLPTPFQRQNSRSNLLPTAMRTPFQPASNGFQRYVFHPPIPLQALAGAPGASRARFRATRSRCCLAALALRSHTAR